MIHCVSPKELKEILTKNQSSNVDDSEDSSVKLSNKDEELKNYLEDEVGDTFTPDLILAAVKECPDAHSADLGASTCKTVLALSFIIALNIFCYSLLALYLCSPISAFCAFSLGTLMNYAQTNNSVSSNCCTKNLL